MSSTTKILAVAASLLIACGDNKSNPDARTPDGPPPDAYCSNCPAAPMVGAQIDRIGRPAINTALTQLFNVNQTAVGTAKDAYNQNSNPATWISSVPAFIGSLAGIDAVDTAFCGNKRCEEGEANAAGNGNVACPGDCPTANQVGAAGVDGCGNQVLYNGMPGGGGNPTGASQTTMNSYTTLAAIMAGDELYLDTSKGNCTNYLAVEFAAATGGSVNSCGGRALQYDVIDTTITVGAIGIAGFSLDGMFTPALGDTVGPHTDYLADFPYLGPPHP